MKILKLKVLNFLGIGAFNAEAGKLNRITGKNGVGKTAILRAIKEGFKSSGVDPHLIKGDADKAEIFIELDNGVSIDRRLTATGNKVKVTHAGEPVNKPQAFLTGLLGAYPFDPTAFYMASPKDRVKLLLSAMPVVLTQEFLTEQVGDNIPIDLSRFDYTRHGLEVLKEIQEAVYDRRHEENLARTRMEKAIEQDKREIPETFATEKWGAFDISEAMTRLKTAQGQISAHEESEKRLTAMRRNRDQKVATIEQVTKQIADLTQRLEDAKKELAELDVEGKALKGDVEGFVAPNIEVIENEVREYQTAQKLINKLDLIKDRKVELDGLSESHAALDTFYKVLTTEVPRNLLASSDLPIADVCIDGDQIVVNGVSLDKLSTSEQMRFAVAGIAKPLAGELKVICVDRYESLDPDAREAFEAEAAKDDFEYFITEVTSGPLEMDSTGDLVSEPVDKEGF